MTPFQKKLEQLKACTEAIEWVGTKTYLQAWKACTRLDWLQWLCKAHARAEYQAQCAPIEAEYQAQCAPIEAEYRAKRASILAEYEAKLASIWAEYRAKLAPIRAEYEAKHTTIRVSTSCDDFRAKNKRPKL